MLRTLAVDNYRSLRRFVLGLGDLTVVTGANGTGKSSLYRSLRLLADFSRNGAIGGLAREGGLSSTLWAGPERIGRAVREGVHPLQGTVRTEPVALRLGFAGDDYGYAIDLGLPPPIPASPFSLDPMIKSEVVWAGPAFRPGSALVDRHGTVVQVRGEEHDWQQLPYPMRSWDSILSELADPRQAPEVIVVRERVRSWRFYDVLRTDVDAPARQLQVGTRTQVLSADGADLPAALATITESGAGSAIDQAIEHAFPGGSVEVTIHEGRFGIAFRQSGLLRPLTAAELSDGTLRYLLWVAALLSERPAELLVLNEPETSLHPSLLAPLGELIAGAAARSQLIIVSHSEPLVAALAAADAVVHRLEKSSGETKLVGQGALDEPAWHWPSR